MKIERYGITVEIETSSTSNPPGTPDSAVGLDCFTNWIRVNNEGWVRISQERDIERLTAALMTWGEEEFKNVLQLTES